MLSYHGRCAYSAIVDRPVCDWPNGTRLAVYIAIDVEHFPFVEHEGAQPRGWLAPTSPSPASRRICSRKPVIRIPWTGTMANSCT